MKLVYKDDGDYDLVVGDVVIELSYDGSDYGEGTWTFWNVRIGEHRFGGTQIIGPGEFHEWLEQHARDADGHLPDEPEAAVSRDKQEPPR